MAEGPLVAIALHVPDRLPQTATGSDECHGLLDDVPELHFIMPAWWEFSYTARLMVLPPQSPSPTRRLE